MCVDVKEGSQYILALVVELPSAYHYIKDNNKKDEMLNLKRFTNGRPSSDTETSIT